MASTLAVGLGVGVAAFLVSFYEYVTVAQMRLTHSGPRRSGRLSPLERWCECCWQGFLQRVRWISRLGMKHADTVSRGFEPRMTRREASLILELPYVPRREYFGV